MGEVMVKNQSNFINLLSARQNVFPMAANVQRWGVVDSSSEDELGGIDEAMSSASSFEERSSSSGSLGSNSDAEDLQDDASSSFEAAATSPRLTRGPLYELSGLMNELPVKRGLSKHFQGKSQSFTSLSNVQTLEDLAKRENPYKKKQMMMKSCKSYACGLDNSKSFATNNSSKMISKKGSNKSVGSFSSLLGSKRNGFMSCSISPPILE
ncbi:hypothetical protein C5167_031728 [Papaver somniferum]|uniref:Oxidative stress 3 n=1 Tax=Papaver somniferum TaxID=3469 RepID=A0A4Y7K999_PAPSO|nr:uncharacterized protein LOC113294223 [Papaver somniferum]RZC68509.1 hypothetical protein C5167_031728 [Papaver somniferum]